MSQVSPVLCRAPKESTFDTRARLGRISLKEGAMEKSISLFCIYFDFSTLRDCVESLRSLDYRTQDISLVFPETAISKGFSARAGAKSLRPDDRSDSNALVVGSLGWLTYVSPSTPDELGAILATLGIPAYDVERYENRIRNGGILVSVRCFSSHLAIGLRDVLRETGAQEISSRGALSLARETRESSRRVQGRISYRAGDTQIVQ